MTFDPNIFVSKSRNLDSVSTMLFDRIRSVLDGIEYIHVYIGIGCTL